MQPCIKSAQTSKTDNTTQNVKRPRGCQHRLRTQLWSLPPLCCRQQQWRHRLTTRTRRSHGGQVSQPGRGGLRTLAKRRLAPPGIFAPGSRREVNICYKTAPGRSRKDRCCCALLHNRRDKDDKAETHALPRASTQTSIPCYDLELGGMELPNTTVHVFLVCIADNVPNAYPLSCTAWQQRKRVRRTRDVRAIRCPSERPSSRSRVRLNPSVLKDLVDATFGIRRHTAAVARQMPNAVAAREQLVRPRHWIHHVDLVEPKDRGRLALAPVKLGNVCGRHPLEALQQKTEMLKLVISYPLLTFRVPEVVHEIAREVCHRQQRASACEFPCAITFLPKHAAARRARWQSCPRTKKDVIFLYCGD